MARQVGSVEAGQDDEGLSWMRTDEADDGVQRSAADGNLQGVLERACDGVARNAAREEATMTFKEFTEEALRIRDEAGDGASVSTDVEFWNKPNDSPPYRIALMWTVWDSILREPFTAPTPETALALYRESKLPKKVDLSGVGGMEVEDA